MPEVGWGALPIIPSFDGFAGKLEAGTAKQMLASGRSGGEKFGDAAGRSAGKRFGGAFKTAAKASLVGLAGLGAAAFKVGGDALEKASDLNETTNKANVIFGKNAQVMRRWSRDAAESFGLSREEALASSAQFGDMFSQLGFADKAAAKMSRRVVQMAADFGSFNNLETDDVLERISAGFRGEYDSLQLLIPNITATRVQKEALAMTGKKNVDALTAEEKAAATLAIVQHDGARAAGDFARTSDSLANQQKILYARFDDVEAKLGTGLLPIATDVVSFLNDKGIPAFEDFSDWFTRKGIPAIEDFADDLKPLAKELLPAAGDAVGIIADGLKKGAPYAKDLVGAFNDMPEWAKVALVGGGAGLLAGKKLGLLGRGKGGALGGGGGLLSKASPIPVFVVNNGPDGGTAGKKGWLAALARWGGPAAVVAAGGAAAASVTPDEDRNSMAPGAGGFAADGGLSLPPGALDFSTGQAPGGGIRTDATRKLLGEIDQGISLSEKFERHIRGVREEIERWPAKKATRFEAPNLLQLLDQTREFDALLDGIDGRVVKAFISSVQTNNSVEPFGDPRFGGRRAGGGGVSPSRYYLVGERGPELFSPASAGRITPNGARPGKSGGVSVHIERLVAHDYHDFTRQLQQRVRAESGGGVTF